MRTAPVCVIVGAGPGIGYGLAMRYGREGYRIGLIARSRGGLDNLLAELAAAGISAHAAVADAGEAAALQSALADLSDALGPATVLIYNAAILHQTPVLELDRETLLADLEVNLLGAQTAVNAVLPQMRQAGKGAILLTGGGLALEPYPEWASLAIGKAALRSYALSLFKALQPEGIHVAVIAICGIVEEGGAFDPHIIAEEYWRLGTAAKGLSDRERVFLPEASNAFYNDPDRLHRATSLPIRRKD